MAYKILIVDDEPDLETLVRQKFRRQVREGRFELDFARDGQEALHKLEQDEGISLVLSDINMPVMDGLTLLSKLEHLDRILKAVMVSAYGDMENIRTAMNRGAFDFVTKPIDFQDLEVTIDKTLNTVEEMRRAAREREELLSLQQELSVAARIQLSILPRTFPAFPDRKDFDIYAEIIPAREVGGDLYDFFEIDEDRIGIAIGDVSGKGVPAAIFMAVTRTLLRATALQRLSTAGCLEYVNKVLVTQSESSMFVTLFYAILNTRTGELEYTCAGHNPPYLFSREGYRTLDPVGGPMVGALEGMKYENQRLQMKPGEMLLLYTDGITEASAGEDNASDDSFFEESRVEQFLADAGELNPKQAVEGLIGRVREFVGEAPQYDDLTVLVAQYLG